MKMAFLISAGRRPSEFLQELRAQLPQDQLIHWTRGESSPAQDIEVLLVLGEVTAAQMARQTNLALIQTATAGSEEIDIDAANELGIWVSFAPSEVTGTAASVAEFAGEVRAMRNGEAFAHWA